LEAHEPTANRDPSHFEDRNNEIAAVAAAHRVNPDRWWTQFGALIDRIAPRFTRYEPAAARGRADAGHGLRAGPQELLDDRRTPRGLLTRVSRRKSAA
jgi:hypothetical protein